MKSDNCVDFVSTVPLNATVDCEQRYLPTMNPIQNIDQVIGSNFLLERQYSSCPARIHLAFAEYPHFGRFDSVDSLATPSDLFPVGDEDIESAELHLQTQVPWSEKLEQFAALFADLAVDKTDLSFAPN